MIFIREVFFTMMLKCEMVAQWYFIGNLFLSSLPWSVWSGFVKRKDKKNLHEYIPNFIKDRHVRETENQLFLIKRQKQRSSRKRKRNSLRNTWRLCYIVDIIGYLTFKYSFQSFDSPWFTSKVLQVYPGIVVHCSLTHTLGLMLDTLEGRASNKNTRYKLEPNLNISDLSWKMKPITKPIFFVFLVNSNCIYLAP